MSSELIVILPEASEININETTGQKIEVFFQAGTETVQTVIDRGILLGIQGPQGNTGGVSSINGQTGTVLITSSEIPEAPSALYFTASRVREVVLTGLSTATNSVIAATDSVLSAFGKLQVQITAAAAALTAHVSNTSNPHNVTKAQVGLGNVDNTSDLNKPISTATQAALNNKADLVGGLIPSSQLPSYVDDVLEYASASAFPIPGQADKIYVALDTNQIYRWGGSVYVTLSEGVVLGETSSTAYRGDRGKAAYDHSLKTDNPHGVTKAQVGLGSVPNVDATNADNIQAGTLNDARLSTNVTKMGNTFNAADKLVKVDTDGKLPALDGSKLTGIISYFDRRHDFVSLKSYCGQAKPGSSESASVWQIKRITVAASGAVTVSTANNVDWTNRLTHTYT